MKTVALGRVAKIDRTVADDNECRTMPYVGLEHIEKDTGHFVDGFTPNPLDMLATNFRFTSRHVLYGKLRPYLNKVALPTFDGVCTTEILPILPMDGELDRIFLWAILLSPSFVAWASSRISGANLPRLDPKLLADYQIPLPPLPEQRRIAAILAKADRLRRLRRTARQLGESFLQSVFVEMFGDGREYKALEFQDILADAPKNGLYLPADLYGSGTPIIRIDMFYNGVLGDPALFKRVRALPKQLQEFRVENGEILINRVNSLEYLGKCAFVKGLTELTLFESNMMRIRVNREIAHPLYVAKYLTTPLAYSQILQRAKKAVNQASINQEDVKSLIIVLPPRKLQERFAGLVNCHDRLLVQRREAERQAEMLFQSLLQRAFVGEL